MYFCGKPLTRLVKLLRSARVPTSINKVESNQERYLVDLWPPYVHRFCVPTLKCAYMGLFVCLYPTPVNLRPHCVTKVSLKLTIC